MSSLKLLVLCLSLVITFSKYPTTSAKRLECYTGNCFYDRDIVEKGSSRGIDASVCPGTHSTCTGDDEDIFCFSVETGFIIDGIERFAVNHDCRENKDDDNSSKCLNFEGDVLKELQNQVNMDNRIAGKPSVDITFAYACQCSNNLCNKIPESQNRERRNKNSKASSSFMVFETSAIVATCILILTLQ